MNLSAPINADITRKQKQLERLHDEINSDFEEIDYDEFDPDRRTLRVIGSQLHDFYTGTEEIFKLIQTQLDQDNLRQRGEWHKFLLERMTEPIDGVRPAVISEEL